MRNWDHTEGPAPSQRVRTMDCQSPRGPLPALASTWPTVSTCFMLIIIIKKETKLLSPLLNTGDVSRLGFPHPTRTHSQL